MNRHTLKRDPFGMNQKMQMVSARFIAVAVLTSLNLAGLNTPVFADSGNFEPRGPVLSGRDPLFAGMLIAPGTNSCRRVYAPYYGWRCSYGNLPPAPGKSGLGAIYDDDQAAANKRAAKPKSRRAQKATAKAAKKISKSDLGR